MKMKYPLALIFSISSLLTINQSIAQSFDDLILDDFENGEVQCGLSSPSNFWYTPMLMGLNKTTIEGDTKIVSSSLGDVVEFDGEGDRLLVDENPIFGAEEFTIEVVLYPYNVYPANTAPRYFHIESVDNSSRRITMEMRLNDQGQWYMDAFIKSDNDQFTLIDETLVHPTEQWAHTAITYKNGKFTSYVNGKRELRAEVQYLPIAENARSSVGARMNQVHWFNGQIHSVATTARALKPKQFKTLNMVRSVLKEENCL